MNKVIALYGRRIQADAAQVFKHLLGLLNRRGFTIICEEESAKILVEYGISKDSYAALYTESTIVDFSPIMLLSVGGDGTFLGAASLVKNRQIPILGINCGRMGFLANVARPEIEKAIDMISVGNYTLSQRDVLGFVSGDKEQVSGYALNEVSIMKSDMASLLTIHVCVNGNFLTTYWADGLVVSTPTGSTAYSMSAGGPIVCPDCRLLLLTPVSPHNLSLRPMAIPVDSKIEITVESRSGDYVLCADSEMYKRDHTCAVRVATEDFKINVVQLPDTNFYDTIRKKLYWGEDMRNSKY